MQIHRKAAVAGYFYPAEHNALLKQVNDFFEEAELEFLPKQKALAIIAPHAGYLYSGQTAAKVYAQIHVPKKIFILSPNHTGEGVPISINSEGQWATPLGEAKIDSHLAQTFMKYCPQAEEDEAAHLEEHSLEVQLPFLQYLKKDFEFVPLTLQHLSYSECEEMGKALAQTIQKCGEEVLVVASSDMNHYESQEKTLQKDQRAIEAILKLDPPFLYEEVHRHQISMCGIIPATIALIASKLLGAQEAKLIEHTTSGSVTGDFKQVVGYASFVIS